MDDTVHCRLAGAEQRRQPSVLRLVRKWINTSSSRTGSGIFQGRPARGGSRCWVMVV
jgi:hypothetical protein